MSARPTMWASGTFSSGIIATDRCPARRIARRSFLKTGLAVLSVAATGAGDVFALSDTGGQILGPEDFALLREVEDYLNNLTTMASRFIQINPDGTPVEGTIYMRRPGEMRVEYDPPDPNLLVATGLFLIVVDRQLGEAMHLPLNLTPAWFFLRENISFNDGLSVLALKRAAGLVRVQIALDGDQGAGSVIVTLQENPLRLRQWTVIDGLNERTRVTLVDTRFGLTLDDALFTYVDQKARRSR